MESSVNRKLKNRSQSFELRAKKLRYIFSRRKTKSVSSFRQRQLSEKCLNSSISEFSDLSLGSCSDLEGSCTLDGKWQTKSTISPLCCDGEDLDCCAGIGIAESSQWSKMSMKSLDSLGKRLSVIGVNIRSVS